MTANVDEVDTSQYSGGFWRNLGMMEKHERLPNNRRIVQFIIQAWPVFSYAGGRRKYQVY